MILKLQWYILRELIKATILSTIALTAMLGLGGSMVNMLQAQGISAFEMLKLLVYLLPVVLTYALPVATLFASTITYGRFSADNEINACRASGINIFRLLIPVVCMGVAVTTITLALTNVVIPTCASRIEHMVRKDSHQIALQKLLHTGVLARYNMVLYAGQVGGYSPAEYDAFGRATKPAQIHIKDVAFMETERNMPVRYGTAEHAVLKFAEDTTGTTIAGTLINFTAYDERRSQILSEKTEHFGPVAMPTSYKPPIKFLSMPQLLRLHRDPMLYYEMRNRLGALQERLTRDVIANRLVRQFNRTGLVEIRQGERTITMRGDSAEMELFDGKVVLREGVEVVETQGNVQRTFLAKSGHLVIGSINGMEDPRPNMSIRLVDVRIYDPRSGSVDRASFRDSYDLPPVVLMESVAQQVQHIDLERLLADDFEMTLGDESFQLAADTWDVREWLIKDLSRTRQKVVSELNGRFCYSLSALVLLTLGAGLGIIFKGGHVVSAFGLSFIPVLVVVVSIMLGRQVTETPGLETIGPLVIWAGLVAVLLANFVVLGKFLRR